MIENFGQLTAHLSQSGRRCRLAVVCGSDASTLEAVARAVENMMVEVVFVGHLDAIAQMSETLHLPAFPADTVAAAGDEEAAAKAVMMVRNGEADVLVKGLVSTDVLLRAVLNKERGILPPGRVLTHVAVSEMKEMNRMLVFSDSAVIPYPTPEQRRSQISYVVNLCRAFGAAEPRLALLHCSEHVSDKFPHTLDYRDIIAEAEQGRWGQVWSRNDRLSLRDRSVVTITSLISQGITDSSLKYHLQTAKANGVTRTEIAEIITHAAFYAGWPKAWAAFRQAKEVWTEEEEKNDCKGMEQLRFPIGSPNTAYAKFFTGNSHLAPLQPKNLGKEEKTVLPMSNVTFEPGCRNNWHIHHNDHQILICVSGRGWYQEWGKPAIALKAGDVIDIPEGVKHWHGAQKDCWFQHIATHIETGNGTATNEWLEPVDDGAYNQLGE